MTGGHRVSATVCEASSLDSARSSANHEFATRIMSSELVNLQDPGVEVSNKLHELCTVVKGAPRARDGSRSRKDHSPSDGRRERAAAATRTTP